MLACDFFVAVTVRFRLLYGFVVLDVGTRRMPDDDLSEAANCPSALTSPGEDLGHVAGSD
jgi:hypothetical protein